MFAASHTPRPHLTEAAKARAVQAYLSNRRLTLGLPKAQVSYHGRPYLPIDTTVPPPPPKGKTYARPFRLMAIGDSFFEPCNGVFLSTLQSRIRWDAKDHSPAKFVMAEETQNGQDGLRVWRVA